MKKRGILNAELMRCIALLGHKDLFMIGDAGMPIPEGVKVIDLAVCSGVPLFNQVFDAVVDETEIEYYYVAGETAVKNPKLGEHIRQGLPGIEQESMSHEELKKKSAECRFAIRTGEFSPYANVILRAGVVF